MSGTRRQPKKQRPSGEPRGRPSAANYNRYEILATPSASSSTENPGESSNPSSSPELDRSQPQSTAIASNQPETRSRKRRYSVAPDANSSTGLTQEVEDINVGEDNEWKTPPGKKIRNQRNIQVSPDKFPASDGVSLDLFGMKLVKDYSRDTNRKLLQTTDYKIYRGLANQMNDNLLEGFKKLEKVINVQSPKRERKGNYSITWLDNYLRDHKDLLADGIHFVSTVGTIRLLLIACYENEKYDWPQNIPNKHEWKIYAKKVNGIWYLSEYWPDSNDGVTPESKYAARMFELLMTSERNIEAAAQAASDDSKNVKTYQIWTARLGDNHLLYSGEVDCCAEDQKDPRRHNREATIELKTTTDWKDLQEKKIRPSIVRRAWAQARLMKNTKVVFGYLKKHGDNSLVLEDTREYETHLMNCDAVPKWKTEVCFAHLNKVLDVLRKENFYKDNVTYELQLDRKNQRIRAKESESDLPLECIK